MLQDEVMVPVILNPSGEDAEPVARLSKVVDLRGAASRCETTTGGDGRAGNNRRRPGRQQPLAFNLATAWNSSIRSPVPMKTMHAMGANHGD